MFGLFGTWMKAEGLIVDSRDLSRSASGATVTREYVVEVRIPGEAPFRAPLGEPFFAMDFWAPSRGDLVGVEYEAKTRKVRFDKSDPRVSAKARERAKRDADEQRFREKLR